MSDATQNPDDAAANSAAFQQLALKALGRPMIMHTDNDNLKFGGMTHHSAVITRLRDDGTVNLKVFPDGHAPYDIQQVTVQLAEPQLLDPGKCCPAGWGVL